MNPIISRIRARLLKRNQNCLVLIAGDTGSGKSYAALRMAELISPDFKINNVVFNPDEFMDILETVRKGDTIIFDEAGVGMPSRDWYTIQNKMLGYVMQTFRSQNLCVIFTVPNISFIDVQVRNLFHVFMETQSIDYKNKKCKMKIFYFRQWPRSEKVQPIHPRGKGKSKLTNRGQPVRYTMWKIGKPNRKLFQDYEERKFRYNENLREETRKVLKDVKERGNPKVTKADMIREALRNGHKQAEVARMFGVHKQTVYEYNKELVSK
jgi:energy-coupling factor transporter ATP-binding protein EcfA2